MWWNFTKPFHHPHTLCKQQHNTQTLGKTKKTTTLLVFQNEIFEFQTLLANKSVID